MRKAMKSLFVALPAALLIAGVASAQDKHTLRIQFEKGKTFHQETQTRMAMKMEYAGQPMDMRMEMSLVSKNHVKEVKEGVATLEQTVLRVRLSMNQPMMGKIEYDSAVEGSDPGPMAQLAKLVGVKVELTLNDRGVVLGTKLPKEFLEDLQGVIPTDEFEKMFGRDFVNLPENPVAIGETWESQSDLPIGNMGEIEMKAKNKLIRYENGVATIEQTFEIASDKIDSPTGDAMKIRGKTTQGEIQMDLTKGEVLRSSQEMEMFLEGEQMSMDMTAVTLVETIPADKVAEKIGQKK